MLLSQMKKIYLLFYASDSRHYQLLQTDKFFELIYNINKLDVCNDNAY